jgi:hypothetical protein
VTHMWPVLNSRPRRDLVAADQSSSRNARKTLCTRNLFSNQNRLLRSSPQYKGGGGIKK